MTQQGEQPSDQTHTHQPIMGVLTEDGKLVSFSEYYGAHAETMRAAFLAQRFGDQPPEEAVRASLLVDWVADRKELDEL